MRIMRSGHAATVNQLRISSSWEPRPNPNRMLAGTAPPITRSADEQFKLLANQASALGEAAKFDAALQSHLMRWTPSTRVITTTATVCRISGSLLPGNVEAFRSGWRPAGTPPGGSSGH